MSSAANPSGPMSPAGAVSSAALAAPIVTVADSRAPGIALNGLPPPKMRICCTLARCARCSVMVGVNAVPWASAPAINSWSSTTEETALALDVLIGHPAAERGLAWLCEAVESGRGQSKERPEARE